MRGDQARLIPIYASTAAPAASRKQKSVLKESKIQINEHFVHPYILIISSHFSKQFNSASNILMKLVKQLVNKMDPNLLTSPHN